MPHTWKPLLDRVLVLQDWGPLHHPGTEIEIPQKLRETQRPNTGRIIAVGPGRRHDDGVIYPPNLSEGQAVMFAPAELATKVEHGEHGECLMLREGDIFLAE